MEHPAYTMAALCGIGGVSGYVRRGSVPSLLFGVGLGSAYAYSGKLIQENADYGIEAAVASSAAVTLAMLPRAITTRKPVPITVTVLGIGALAYYGKKYSDYYL